MTDTSNVTTTTQVGPPAGLAPPAAPVGTDSINATYAVWFGSGLVALGLVAFVGTIAFTNSSAPSSLAFAAMSGVALSLMLVGIIALTRAVGISDAAPSCPLLATSGKPTFSCQADRSVVFFSRGWRRGKRRSGRHVFAWSVARLDGSRTVVTSRRVSKDAFDGLQRSDPGDERQRLRPWIATSLRSSRRRFVNPP